MFLFILMRWEKKLAVIFKIAYKSKPFKTENLKNE